MAVQDNVLELQSLLDRINVTLTQQKENFDEVAGAINNYNSSISKSPSEFVGKTKDLTDSLEKQRLAEIKLEQAREKAFDKYEARLQKEAALEQKKADIAAKNAAKEQAALERSENFYEKLRSKISRLTVEYNNLAARREFGITLNDREAARVAFLEAKINRYGNALDKVNTDIGKYQQRVGQYGRALSSGFDPVSNSVSRLAQEIPNLGQSFQIFAMSIGNNLAAVKDSYDQIIQRNKALQAEGKATTSAVSQFASSIFSLNTLFYVAIALFISFSDEMSRWVSGLQQGQAVLETLTKAQNEFNKAKAEGSAESEIETRAFRRNLDAAKDTTLDMRSRMAAIQLLRKEYKPYLKDVTDAELLNGKWTNSIWHLLEAIDAQANFGANQKVIDNIRKQKEELQAELDARRNYAEERRSLFEDINKYAATIPKSELDKMKELYKELEKVEDLRKEQRDAANEDNPLITGTSDKEIENAIKRLDALINSRRRENDELYKKTLILKEQEEKEKKGRTYDPEAAILAARLRYLKQYAEASEEDYQEQRQFRQREIDELTKIATDEKRSYDDRIQAYGEMLKKKQELVADDLVRQQLQLKNQEEVAIAEADKALRAELKQAGPNAKARAKIQAYYEGEKELITIEYNARRNKLQQKSDAELIDIERETAKAIYLVQEELRKTLLQTEQNQIQARQRQFKKASEDERLSLEVRQAYYESYIATRKQLIDIEEQEALLATNGTKAEYDAVIARFADIRRALNEESAEQSPVAKALKYANDQLKELKKTLTEGVFADAGFSSLNQLFDGTFDKVIEGFDQITEATQEWGKTMSLESEKSLKKFQYTFAAIGEVAKDAFAFINQFQQRNYDNEIARLEKQKDIAIRYSRGSAEERQEIEEQYEQRRRQLARERARQEKATALFEAIVNTASAVVAALPNIALAAVVGVLGAAQIALIASAPIPEYRTGRKGGKAELAITQEEGPEAIVDRRGKIKSWGSDKGAQKTWLEAGDSVKTASETRKMWDEYTAFNDGLNSVLLSNNIGSQPAPIVVQKNGATASEFRQVLKEVIGNRPIIQTTMDENGFSQKVLRNGQKTISLKKRLSGKGDSV